MDAVVDKHKEDADRNELLLWASARGLAADAAELVASGADPATVDKAGARPVHYAASHGHLSLLQFLSSKGVDLDVEDPRGRTALHCSAVAGHLKCIQFLVGKGCWADAFDAQDDAPLHLAARGGHCDCVAWLCRTARAKIALRNKRDLTALGEALVNGHMDSAAVLLSEEQAQKKGSLEPSRGFTPMHLVCGLGLVDCAKLLLGEKVDVNECSNEERLTPLHAAALAGSAQTCELLLSNGADARLRTQDGCLPSELVPEGGSTADGTAAANTVAKRILSTAEAKKGAKPRGAAPSGGASDNIKGASGKIGVDNGKGATWEGDGDWLTGGPSKPSLEWFKGLTQAEQLKKVDTYSKLASHYVDDLGFVAGPIKEQLAQIQKLDNVLEGFKAVAAVRFDAQFQEDATDPDVQAAMEEIKRTNSSEKYQNDSRVRSVMTKLSKLKGLLRRNGNLQINLEDLLVTTKPENSFENTAGRLQALEAALQAARVEAADALCGKKAAQVPPQAPPQAPTRAPSQGGKESSASSCSAVGPADLPAHSEPRLNPAGDSWREFLTTFFTEMGMTMLRQAVLVGIAMLVLWAMGSAPWQMSAHLNRKLAERAAAAAATAAGVENGGGGAVEDDEDDICIGGCSAFPE